MYVVGPQPTPSVNTSSFSNTCAVCGYSHCSLWSCYTLHPLSSLQVVLALYPQTTCFYKAVVHERPNGVSQWRGGGGSLHHGDECVGVNHFTDCCFSDYVKRVKQWIDFNCNGTANEGLHTTSFINFNCCSWNSSNSLCGNLSRASLWCSPLCV